MEWYIKASHQFSSISNSVPYVRSEYVILTQIGTFLFEFHDLFRRIYCFRIFIKFFYAKSEQLSVWNIQSFKLAVQLFVIL